MPHFPWPLTIIPLSSKPPATDDNDLDFTRPSKVPAPPPKPEKVAQAKAEAPKVAPQLEHQGFYVSIARQASSTAPLKTPGRSRIARSWRRWTAAIRR